MSTLYCFVVLAILGSTLAFSGEFVPKSFYTIDENGEKSDVIYLRKGLISRIRRMAHPSEGGGGFGADGAIAFDGPINQIASAVGSGLDQIRALSSRGNFGAEGGVGGGSGSGSGAHSFSGSFSSGGGGPGQGGAVLHSRFAGEGGGVERELVTGGNGGIHAAASAQGPHGAYSVSSSSVDSNGQARYNVKAHQY